MTQLGKILIVSGMVLVIAGVIFFFAGDKIKWFGNLPGDIRIEKENVRFYFPVTTMVIISILLSFILWLLKKLF